MPENSGVGTDLGGIAFSVTIDTSTFDKKMADIVETTSAVSKEISTKPVVFDIETTTVQKKIITLTQDIRDYKNELSTSTSPVSIENLSAAIVEAQSQLILLKNIGKQGFDELGNAIEKVPPVVKEAEVSMRSFRSSLGGLGSNFIAFLAIQKLIQFGSELLSLIPKVEGVDNAFARLGEGEKGLNALRVQTKGLISDLELEKFAVKFADFNIPVDKLGYLLSFASERAQGLGLSVEEVAEKMVSGLGAKGPRAFAALGISAEQFNAAMAKTGNRVDALALAISDNLVGENLDKIETLGDKITKLGVDAENAKKKIIEFISAPFNDVPGGLLDHYKEQQEKRFGDTEKMTKDQLRKNSQLLTDEIHEFDKRAATARDNQVTFQLKGYTGIKGANEFVSGADYANAETEAKAQEKARQASLETIKAKLKSMAPDDKDILNTIKKLTDAQAAVREALVDKTDPKEIKALTNKANGYQKQIDDLDGTTDNNNRKKAEAEAAAMSKKNSATQRKAKDDLHKINQTLIDDEKQLAQGDVTPLQQKLFDLAAKYDQLRSDNKADSKILGVSSKPENDRLDASQAKMQAQIIAQADKEVKEKQQAEDLKNQEQADKDELTNRRELFQAEQSFEDLYSIAAVKKYYGVQVSSFQDYKKYLEMQIAGLTPSVEDGTATEDQKKKRTGLIQALTNLTTDNSDKQRDAQAQIEKDAEKHEQRLLDIHEKGLAERRKIDEDPDLNPESKAALDKSSLQNEKSATDKENAAKVKKTAESVARYAHLAAESFSEIANSVREANPQLATFLDGLSQAATQLGSIAQAFASGPVNGAIAVIAAGVENLVKSISGIFTSSAMVSRQIANDNKAALAGLLEYQLAALTTQESQAMADSQHLASLRQAKELTQEQTSLVQAQQEKDLATLKKSYVVTSEEKKYNPKQLKSFLSQKTVLGGTMSLDDLLKAGAEGKLQSAAARAAYADYIQQQTQLNALKEQEKQIQDDINTAMLGQSKDSVTSGIEDAITLGTTQFVNFGATVTDILRKSIIAGFFQTPEMVAQIKVFEDTLLADLSSDSGTLTAAHAAELKAEGAVIQLNTKKLTAALNAAGVGVGTGTDATIAGAFKGITEDTAELLAGRFNALGLTALNQLDTANKSFLALVSIERNTFGTFQALDYITQNMVKAGAVGDTFNKTLRAGGTFL